MTYGVLILIVDTFVPLGRILGRLMNSNPNPIWAYSVNIFGSILGTWSFVLLSFFYQPPFTWFIIIAIFMAIFVYWSNRGKRLNFALLGAIIVLSWFVSQVPDILKVVWSPYQKLTVGESPASGIGDYYSSQNNVGYQVIIDLNDAGISAHPEKFQLEFKGLSQYDVPLLLHPNPSRFNRWSWCRK